MTDHERFLHYINQIYSIQPIKMATIEGAKLMEVAAAQLVKYIIWLEKEAGKLN